MELCRLEEITLPRKFLISSRGPEQKEISNSKRMTCHYRKRKGPFARDCFKKKADQGKPPRTHFANKAEVVSLKYSVDILATVGK